MWWAALGVGADRRAGGRPAGARVARPWVWPVCRWCIEQVFDTLRAMSTSVSMAHQPTTRSEGPFKASGSPGTAGAAGVAGVASELMSALACIEQGLDALAAVDPGALHVADLAAGALELQRLADRVQVALARVLVRADRMAVWQGTGSKNAAGWLADATGSGYGAACDLLRLGDSLETSAALAAKVDGGEMSAATAVALHRTISAPPERATRADVDRLVEICTGASPSDARKAAEIWKDGHRSEAPDELEAQRFARRAVRFAPEVDGLVRTTADLPTLEAHMLRKALTSVGGRPSDDDRRTTEQRLADALVTLADHALHGTPAAACGASGPHGSASDATSGAAVGTRSVVAGDVRSGVAVDATTDALAGAVASASARPTGESIEGRGAASSNAAVAGGRPSRAAVPGTGRQRVDLLVTIDLQSLVGHDDPSLDQPGIDEFGGRIPASVVRRLAENASIERIVHAGSRVLDHGRAVRLATDDQYRALVARDGGCRWPGCDKPASWCEVDHLVPWHQGGLTDLNNLVLLCAAHHTEKHRAGTVVVGDATDLEIIRPDGVVMWCPPKGVMAGPHTGPHAGTGVSHSNAQSAAAESAAAPCFAWPLQPVSAVRSRLTTLVPSMLTRLVAAPSN